MREGGGGREEGAGVAKHSPAATHNEASGVFHAPVVQTGWIAGDVYFAAGASPSVIDEWAEGLAQGVQTLWQQEEEHRKIHDPIPLPVRWHPAAAELIDHWANIRRVPTGTDAAEPLAVAGSIDELVEVYRRVPSGRLVLLGPAGSGKTVLAARLALDLLHAHQPGEPVPVIVSVGSWNPATTALPVWLGAQLARDHPGLATPVEKRGRSRAAALIEAGRVLPILDGFDEIDAELYEDAVRQLNTIQAPMVVTSRAEEYTAAVRGVDVLTAAAVVELDELSVDDLAAYLPRTAAGPRAGMWDAVVQRMRDEPHAPGPATLRGVLANPLMVFVARTRYSDAPGRNPTELLDSNWFPTGKAVQEYLLAEFVPAVYRADPSGSPRRRWPADDAHRYLTYLADHLQKAGTRDLAWWQLRDTIPRWQRTLVLAVVDGLVAGLAAGLAAGLPAGFTVGLAGALASGLTVALTVGLTRGLRNPRVRDTPRFLSSKRTIALVVMFVVVLTDVLVVELAGVRTAGLMATLGFGIVAGFVAGLIGLRSAGPQPTRTHLQIRGRARFIARRFWAGFWVGLLFGFPGGFSSGLVVGLAGGLVVGFVVGLAAALVFGLEAPADAAEVVSAAQSLARDRTNTIRKMLVASLVLGLAVGLAVVAVLAVPGVFPAVGVLAVAVAVGFVSVRATSAWIYWLVLTRGWLPLTGRLPWRVQAFLTDAYQRGVLRQTGAVYQFRHARMQDHLTTDTPATDSGAKENP